jgi:hypothetical protein
MAWEATGYWEAFRDPPWDLGPSVVDLDIHLNVDDLD